MPIGYRETTVRVFGVERTVRTDCTGTVAQLEKTHTQAVRDAAEDLRAAGLPVALAAAEERAQVAEHEAWNHPSRAQVARAKKLRRYVKSMQSKNRFSLPPMNWDDARGGWPAVQFTIPVTDPRVADCHEWIEPVIV